MSYNERYGEYLKKSETALLTACNACFKDGSKVSEAARYSLFAGGKRVRAVLCLASCEMLVGNLDIAAEYAAAIEMVHCASLIHDDMPCIDDDDYRRGQPSCHKKYGEANAMLAGDILQIAAFETLASSEATPMQNLEAVKTLSAAFGARGVFYGEELDIFYENRGATENELYEIHCNKTGKLINAAVQLGAIAADAFSEDKTALERYAEAIGLVFQIVDDVLNVTSTQETLGKPIGSDAQRGKTTFVTLLGVKDSMALAQKLTNEACSALEASFGDKSQFLCELARQLLNRNK